MKRNSFITIASIYVMISGFFFPLLFPQDSNTGDNSDLIAELGNEATLNFTTMALRVKGNGFGPENVKELGRRKILARRAAQMDAYRNFLEVIKGVQVTSNTTVESMMISNDSVRTKAAGMVKGMQVIDITYSNDGGCEVTMEINIDENGNFLLAALDSGEVNVKDDYPKFDWISQRNELTNVKNKCALLSTELESNVGKLKYSDQELAVLKKQLNEESIKLARLQEKKDSVVNSNYTGVLVDARGFDLKPALAPSIINEKNEKMYGIGSLPIKLSRGTNTSYLRGDVEWVKKNKNDKIGNNPLVLKCIKPVNKSDIMISNDDVQKLVWIDELLEKEKVAILI